MWSNFDNSVHNTSGGGLNDSRGSTSGQTGNAKRGENVVPVMIRHLINSYDDLKIWGTPVRTLTFIGILRYIDYSTTKATYEIEDETGRITAFRWLESENQTEKFVLNLNTYVRVYGHLREQSGKKHVLILRIWPLTNLNELTNHLLEVTYTMLKMEKINNTENENVSMIDANSVSVSDDNLSGLTREQALVFKIIQAENDTENGIDKDTIMKRVPKTIAPIVDEIIDFLTSEGHVYTTITDNHFKTT